MPLPADQLPVDLGLNPVSLDGSFCTFYVSVTSLDLFNESHPPSKMYDHELLYEAIKAPQKIYRGLKRLGYDGGYCFSSCPPERHDDAGNKVPASDGRVFVIYATMEQYGPVIFDWNWREGDPNNGSPSNTSDFEEQVWPQV